MLNQLLNKKLITKYEIGFHNSVRNLPLRVDLLDK